MHPAFTSKAPVTIGKDGRHQCPLLEVHEVIRYDAKEAGITIRSVSDIPKVLRWSIAREGGPHATYCDEVLQSGPDSWFSLADYDEDIMCSCGRWGHAGWGQPVRSRAYGLEHMSELKRRLGLTCVHRVGRAGHSIRCICYPACLRVWCLASLFLPCPRVDVASRSLPLVASNMQFGVSCGLPTVEQFST